MKQLGYKKRLPIYFGLLALFTIIIAPAYADQVVKPTSGGTLNVSFSTDPASPNPGDQTQLQIRFLKGTAVQPHIDYKVSVMEGNNQICGTPVLHTAEGSINIPCMLPDTATYHVIVEVDGIVFQPIPPETATFTVNIGNANSQVTNQTVPEFGPVASLVLVIAVVSVITLNARTKGFLKF
jgi:hypothetical protein